MKVLVVGCQFYSTEADPALTVWHDQALAMVYGSTLGGWVYIVTDSLLALLTPQPSFSTILAPVLAAAVVALLCIRGLIRFDKRPGPKRTDQCSEGTQAR